MRLSTRLILMSTVVSVLSPHWQLLAAPGFPQSPGSQATSQPKAPPPPEARVDINHASFAEILKVPGMTQSWAGRIVRFRPYRTKQDLLDRGVLPSSVYDHIREYIIAHRDKQ
jgi:DNA uptake protein ComE-like DNA-binding protein